MCLSMARYHSGFTPLALDKIQQCDNTNEKETMNNNKQLVVHFPAAFSAFFLINTFCKHLQVYLFTFQSASWAQALADADCDKNQPD